ncbi:MAG: hypothetical protein KGQ49_01090, partial [Verrucomicrobia bacterium]|nr:hypothetical protein [Verrucomicrobiota bacterium]
LCPRLGDANQCRANVDKLSMLNPTDQAVLLAKQQGDECSAFMWSWLEEQGIPLNLQELSEEFREQMPYEYAQLCVQDNPLNIFSVPKKFITEEFIKWLEKEKIPIPLYQNTIPEQLITPQLALLSLRDYPESFALLPETFHSPEFIQLLEEHNIGVPLEKIPKEYITPKLAQLAAQLNPGQLLYWPDHVYTPEVMEWCAAHHIVPGRFPRGVTISNLEFAKLAIQENPDHSRHLSQHLITPGFVQWLEDNKIAIWLDVMPEELRENITDEYAKLCVRKYRTNIRYVPKRLLRSEFIQWLEENKRSIWLGDLSEELREHITEAYAKLCVQWDITNIRHVPNKLFTREFIEWFEQHEKEVFYSPGCSYTGMIPLPLERIPKDLITMDRVLPAVVMEGPWAIQSVPEEVMTEYLAALAVVLDASTFKIIPEKYKTLEICRCAVMKDPKNLAFVPEALQKDAQLLPSTPTPLVPVTSPLPLGLQNFVDQHLNPSGESPSFAEELWLGSRGFVKLGTGSNKSVWTHPDLHGYVLKISPPRPDSLVQEVITMLRLKKIVAEHNLRILIPDSYLIAHGDQIAILQQRVDIQAAKDPQPDLDTLIKFADKAFYPLIPDAIKTLPPRLSRPLMQRLGFKKMCSEFGRQLQERVWIRDLVPEDAHNGGIDPDTGFLAIIDGAV